MAQVEIEMFVASLSHFLYAGASAAAAAAVAATPLSSHCWTT